MMFFFFQAEDGIRDIGVTGVQTCALPIFGLPADDLRAVSKIDILLIGVKAQTVFGAWLLPLAFQRGARLIRVLFPGAFEFRSEERRVGKSVDLGGRRIIKKKKEINSG